MWNGNALRTTFVGVAIQAGIGQATKYFPSYSQGVQGYAKRYGAALADFTIGEFMSTYAFPSLLHQDPRYFRDGEGTIKRRLGHALASAFVTRTDSGRRSFNWSIRKAGSLREVSPRCITRRTALSGWCFPEPVSA
jgi:hypothetical protein